MLPHQERVITEKKELDEKLAKLKEFSNNEIYYSLSSEDQELLSDQYSTMKEYSEILEKRILRFNH